MQITSGNLQGLFNRRFLDNFLPLPARCRFRLGERLPDFQLIDADKQVHQLSSYRGKPVVLLFTRIFTERQYCPFCYPHILAVNEAYKQFVGLGAIALMITSTDTLQSQKIQQELSLELPLLVDSDHTVFRRYGTGQALGAPLPAQFVLDAQGRLRFQHLFSFAHTNATPERLLWAVRNL
ncbi:peroxiredoxin family protein [cf. Phormidesmis sp. LEGE 11477]|uniref:peroxiredoxin family protein n=1 Tax=cf. Phormidesmis sp. LEGE 11477 TaxID=1828680 RepID=UPI00188233C3|nr:peroxiredoxin family protein [cf. Phormidesmis sp. LEGE 11477]MBE9061838.1 redoxin domain-containing protein [cf. Phormidesmis sp. LEGE 11477]